jgi:predicted DNA-binding transcriptional regulator AlpA
MSTTAELEAPAAGSPKRVPLAAAVYDAPDLADLLTVSERQVWRMKDAGLLPPALRIGRLVRWQRSVIDEWIARGCPKPRPKNG